MSTTRKLIHEHAVGQHELSGNLFGKFQMSSPYLESSFKDFFGLCSKNSSNQCVSNIANTLKPTLSPLSRISSAFAPRTVQCTAIFSLRLIPKDLTVYLAFEKTGVWPVKDSKTLAARVKRSPLSPTQIFKHNLRMCNSLMGFLALLVFAVSAMA
mgnify:CR=1 FL=1